MKKKGEGGGGIAKPFIAIALRHIAGLRKIQPKLFFWIKITVIEIRYRPNPRLTVAERAQQQNKRHIKW